jgi:hypothetical protein
MCDLAYFDTQTEAYYKGLQSGGYFYLPTLTANIRQGFIYDGKKFSSSDYFHWKKNHFLTVQKLIET